MKKLILFLTILFALSVPAWPVEYDVDSDNDQLVDGIDIATDINGVVTCNGAGTCTVATTLTDTDYEEEIPFQSDCSGITDSFCVDSDDGIVYYYDGGSVEIVGSVSFQPLEATLTDVADGTITEDLVNTANPWADDEVADDISITNISQVGDITATASEINTPLAGRSVTNAEFQQLETIGTTTISANQWSAIGGMNETLTSSELNLLDGVTFVMDAVVDDTSPQLGGPLDFNDQDIYETPTAFTGADTTPDVLGGTNFKTGGTDTYSDFDDGTDHTNLQDGKIIYIQADHAATLDCTASEITCNEGANLTLEVGDLVTCQYMDASTNVDGIGDGQWLCKSSNDNDTGGATAWDDITNPDADDTIGFTGYEITLSTTIDESGGQTLTIDHTDTNGLANSTYLLTLEHSNDGDSNAHFIQGLDNNTDQVWSIRYDGSAHFAAINLTASDTPGQTYDDAQTTVETDDAKIYFNSSDTGAGTEDTDAFIQVQDNSTLTTKIEIDADNTGSGGPTDFKFLQDAAAYVSITTADGGATTIGQTSDGTDQIIIGDGTDDIVNIRAGDEDLKFSDGGTDQIDVGSDTGVDTIDFGSMDIVTTGKFKGGMDTVVNSATAAYSVTTAQAQHHTFFLTTNAATTTYTLPSAAAGMAVCAMMGQGNAQILRFDTDGTDYLVMPDGTRTSVAGDYYGLTSDNGNMLCAVTFDATDWYITTERGGTGAEQ